MKKKKKKNNRDVPLCVMPCVTCWGMLHATMSCPGRAAACPVAVGVARCWRHHGVEGGLQTESEALIKRRRKCGLLSLLALARHHGKEWRWALRCGTCRSPADRA